MGYRSINTTTHFPGRSDLAAVSVLVDGVAQLLYPLPGGGLFLVSRPGSAYQVQVTVPQRGEMEYIIFDSEADDSGGYEAYPSGRLGNVLNGAGPFVLDKTGDDDQSQPLEFKSGAGYILCVLYNQYQGGYSCDPFPSFSTGAFQRGARLGDLTIHYGSKLELILRLLRLKKSLPAVLHGRR